MMAVAPAGVSRAEEDPEVLIRQGVALRKAGDNAKAHGYFQRAYSIAKTPRAAAQLGLVESALGVWANAEGHLAEAVRATTDAWIKTNQTILADALIAVRSNLGQLRVSGTPAGALVRVAGASYGELPLPEPLFLAPGPTTVQVEAKGHQAGSRSVVVVAGKTENAEFHLVPVGLALNQTGGAMGGADAPAQGAAGGWQRPVAWAAGGVALGLAAGGVLAVLAARANYQDFNRVVVPETGKLRCNKAEPNAGGGRCQEFLSAGDRYKTLAIVSFAGAAALGATSAILFVTSGRRQESERELACAPSLGETLGAACRWRF